MKIENFRLFGSGSTAFVLPLRPGLTALVGENDAGKTAVIDAIRMVLGTRDQEYLRLEPTDFHQPPNGDARAEQILIRCTFQGLTHQDRGTFAEYLTYQMLDGGHETVLHITWVAKMQEREGVSRRYLPTEWRSGANGDGPLLDPGVRFLLTATYLRPLRDAERAMSAGRGSRLSQILQHTKDITSKGKPFNKAEDSTPDPGTLSVLGLGDYVNHLFEESEGIKETLTRLNEDYLRPLSFYSDHLTSQISVSRSSDDVTRLRQMLEKLEVGLTSLGSSDAVFGRGLGSNNLLFMACELLLLATEEEGFPLLLIEEPEAHLHPQRQLRLMSFLQEQVKKPRVDGQQIQIIVTTHSPNFASDIRLDNLVLIRDRRAFNLAQGQTKLAGSDYRFLERFLDVTRANLFFARGVIIVEGDAENILLPTIAQLVGRDLREYGVSLVNVRSSGLRRYANIFLRHDSIKDGEITVPVACVTDMDVMPDCAPHILGKLKEGESIPKIGSKPGESKRRWRVKSDFPGQQLGDRRHEIRNRAHGQRVRTFVSDEWTFEYDLAFAGLAEEVWVAATLAKADESIHDGKTTASAVRESAKLSFAQLEREGLPREVLASNVFALFASDDGSKPASKPIAAQYLAELLADKFQNKEFTAKSLRERLPAYLVNAIVYVTMNFETEGDPPFEKQTAVAEVASV